MVNLNPKSRKLPSKPLLHKAVFYWPDRASAEVARQAIVDQYPTARIVEYLRGYAVQLYKSGPYLPLEEPELQQRMESPGGEVWRENPRSREIGRYVNDYETAEAFLGNKNSRKLTNNTVVHWDGGGPIHVRLHRTNILTYLPSGMVILDSGGYQSKTTKQRMNELLPPGYDVYQKRHEWFVHDRITGITRSFEDGMVLDPKSVLRIRQREGREENPGEPKYGVFLWRGDGRYRQSDAVKKYTQRGAAERHAETLNETYQNLEGGGGGYVVRELQYLLNPRRRNRSMTYGEMPGRQEFYDAFKREDLPRGRYRISNSRSEIVPDGDYTDDELFDLTQKLARMWENEHDVEAGDWASSILQTLGFEWV